MQNALKLPAPTQSRLACALGLALASQTTMAAAVDKPLELGVTTVDGQEDAQSPLPQPNSPKYTQPLRDIPQTITIVPETVIKQQNLLSLQNVLSTVPGITFNAGEGGGGYGDSINMRGFSASNDITIDGVRDSAQYSRSDTFNLQQVEVINGANSVYSGVGSIGGNINLVSKAPTLTDFNHLSAAVGTDSYKRTTADINHQIDDTTAFRLNLMAHSNNVSERDDVDYNRWGIAPSIAFGLGTDTRLTLSYLHQEDKNTPDYGVPFFQGGTLPGVKRSNFYGYNNVDEQDDQVNSLTAKLEHDFNDALKVSNLTRYSVTDQKATVNPPQGTWCLGSGVTAVGVKCSTPGKFTPSGPRGTVLDTQNTMLFNQTDLTSKFSTGFIDHTLVLGLTLSKERYDLDSGNAQRTANGGTYNYVPMDIRNPDSHYDGPQNYYRAGHNDGDLTNNAVYAFDTLKLDDHWEINGGARFERNEDKMVASTYTTNGKLLTQTTSENNEDLFSWRAGLVYKPVEAGSFYFAYSNSKTPSDATVNGSCLNALASADNCSVAPETAKLYELGTKWDLLNDKLSLTGSIFRNERTNYKVSSGDPLIPEQQLQGKARVDGVTLGASGLITKEWSVFANYTYLKSEVIQGVSDYVAETAGDPNKGNPLPFTPRNALNVWTTYDLSRDWQVGYGLTGQSAQRVDSTDADAHILVKGYFTHRAMVDYKVNRNLDLQLNVDNLFNKDYYTNVRGGSATTVGWATPGSGRSATLSANYNF
ncbi:TonB-dependent siderophore receptor [Pseudomonas sp. 1912-s]|uniref:TonB-dependent receptor n=1 Tax=Pseudomonas sp. 1912-s TaxID=3033802 RepID=UPI0023DE9D90|nr:TonB-dependent siderophore receptor [Pseudomonas sp. 1912-s]MDF3201803.1 TonB-dependent siderophore receptor [Pseudomonas sp. 1912-s]